jgi:hypothetical protein
MCKTPHSLFFWLNHVDWCWCTQMTIILCLFSLLFFYVYGDHIFSSPQSKNESYAERQHIYVHVVLIGFYTDSLPQFQYLLYCTWPLSIYCSECRSASLLRRSQVSQPDRVCCITVCLNSCAIVESLPLSKNKCYKLVFASINSPRY